ncbi:hypothetical protein DFH06DRAFT_1131331 [Mycena polygramma]|nr:hypothetical protein DFH06DRAFT_1131331 [Mycena polygramma]
MVSAPERGGTRGRGGEGRTSGATSQSREKLKQQREREGTWTWTCFLYPCGQACTLRLHLVQRRKSAGSSLIPLLLPFQTVGLAARRPRLSILLFLQPTAAVECGAEGEEGASDGEGVAHAGAGVRSRTPGLVVAVAVRAARAGDITFRGMGKGWSFSRDGSGQATKGLDREARSVEALGLGEDGQRCIVIAGATAARGALPATYVLMSMSLTRRACGKTTVRRIVRARSCEGYTRTERGRQRRRSKPTLSKGKQGRPRTAEAAGKAHARGALRRSRTREKESAGLADLRSLRPRYQAYQAASLPAPTARASCTRLCAVDEGGAMRGEGDGAVRVKAGTQEAQLQPARERGWLGVSTSKHTRTRRSPRRLQLRARGGEHAGYGQAARHVGAGPAGKRGEGRTRQRAGGAVAIYLADERREAGRTTLGTRRPVIALSQSLASYETGRARRGPARRTARLKEGTRM